MEAPGRGGGVQVSGVDLRLRAGDYGNHFKLEETRDADALLIGRVTYAGFAGAWPSREGEFADKFNSMPKYVVSSTLDDRTGTTRPSSATRRRGGGS